MREFIREYPDYDGSPSPKPRKTGLIVIAVIFFILTLSTVIGIISFRTISSNHSVQLSENSNMVITTARMALNDYINTYTKTMDMLQSDTDINRYLAGITTSTPVLNRFDSLLAESASIEAVYLGTSDSAMLLRPDMELPDGYDPTARPWYIDAVTQQTLIFSGPYQDISQNDVILSLALPCSVSENSKKSGVVGIDVSMKDFSPFLQAAMPSSLGTLMVLSPDLIVLSHPAPELVGISLSAQDNPDRSADAPSGEADRYMSDLTYVAEVISSAGEFDDYRHDYTAGGNRYYMHIQKTDLGWYIVHIQE